MEKIWRDVVGFENKYMVSADGDVLCKCVTNTNQFCEADKSKMLKHQKKKNGVVYVYLNEYGKQHQVSVNKLLKTYFPENVQQPDLLPREDYLKTIEKLEIESRDRKDHDIVYGILIYVRDGRKDYLLNVLFNSEHKNLILWKLKSFTKSSDAIEDAYFEMVINVFGAIDKQQFVNCLSPMNWIIAIAKHKLLNEIKKYHKRKLLFCDLVENQDSIHRLAV